MSNAARKLSRKIWELSESVDGQQACVTAGALFALSSLVDNALMENLDIANFVTGAFARISTSNAGKQSCIDAGVPSKLVFLTRAEAIQESDVAVMNIARSLWNISQIDEGRQACIDADAPYAYIDWAYKKSAKENALIWLQGTDISTTGSVLVKLAQNGYTREASQIIGLSHTASLVGRDSNGGLTELWDVMGQVKGKGGITRLMAVCITRGSLSPQRAKALIRDHNANALSQDQFGWTALHFSVGTDYNDYRLFNDINIDLIRVLVEMTPETLRVKDRQGRLPLHTLLYNSAKAVSIDVIKLLLVYPDGAKEKDKSGMLPLHLCCDNGQPFEVIKFLLELYPEGTKVVDKHGDLPLHIVCRRNAPVEIIKAIIDVWPNAARERGKGGQIPLYWSCGRTAPFEVIKILLDAYPEGVNARYDYGSVIHRHRLYDEFHLHGIVVPART
jgi:ankyrin repeat protein